MRSKLSAFWKELRRRKVIKVLAWYAGVGFVVIELANNVAEPLNLPEWTPRLVIILVIIGFPIAAIISWIFDITPEGIKKTSALETDSNTVGTTHDRKLSNSIAVLPFQDMSPQKDQEYFCDGISEEIINVLTRVESLKVIARTSAFAFKGKQMDIREIGGMLQVENVLEGSIRKDGNQLRITAQLIKVSDGSHLWSEAYNRELKDIFTIQEEISLSIVERMKVKIIGEEKKALVKPPTENTEAYQYYLKGLYYWQMMTPEGNRLAQENYHKAIETDPDFALVYATLGSNILYSATLGFVPPLQTRQISTEYTLKALEINSSMSVAHSTLAVISMMFDWNWEEAEQKFKHALELNPNSGWDHYFYSAFLRMANRLDEAITESIFALEMDPFNIYISTQVGKTYLMAGMVDQAIEKQEWTIGIYPNNFMAHLHLGEALQVKDMPDKAIEAYGKAVQLSGANPLAVSHLACAYYESGKKEEAEKKIQSLEKRMDNEYIQASVFIPYCIIRGEIDQAYQWLEKAVNEKDFNLIMQVITPIPHHRLPKDERFKDLLEQIGIYKFLE